MKVNMKTNAFGVILGLFLAAIGVVFLVGSYFIFFEIKSSPEYVVSAIIGIPMGIWMLRDGIIYMYLRVRVVNDRMIIKRPFRPTVSFNIRDLRYFMDLDALGKSTKRVYSPVRVVTFVTVSGRYKIKYSTYCVSGDDLLFHYLDDIVGGPRNPSTPTIADRIYL